MQPNAFQLAWFLNAASVGAWVAQWLELVSNMPEEIDYIWRAPTRTITYLYLFSRYFPLCSQIANIILGHAVYTSNNFDLCVNAYIVRAIGAQLTLACLEFILAIRVHALYNCSYRIGQFLVIIVLIGTTLETAGISWSAIALEPAPRGTVCVPKVSGSRHTIVFSLGCGLIQSTLLVMTLGKIIMNKMLRDWLRTPVVSLMIRDGILIFAMLSLVIVAVTTEVVWNHGLPVWNATQSWSLTFTSIAGCRLIMSMRKLAATHSRNRPQSYRLTSIFEDDMYFSEIRPSRDDTLDHISMAEVNVEHL